MDREMIAHRHSMVGYDPLDKALRNQRVRVTHKRASLQGAGHAKSREHLLDEYHANVKHLLCDHLEAMARTGLVFHHVFERKRFGFSVLVARYGDEGRSFVEVEETHAHCEVYPGPLKPTDELIAVDGKLILEPRPPGSRDGARAEDRWTKAGSLVLKKGGK
tara:strand:- start:82 stop:567 length:486 start_codon:yes stop_codon:yes gene_type:complete